MINNIIVSIVMLQMFISGEMIETINKYTTYNIVGRINTALITIWIVTDQ